MGQRPLGRRPDRPQRMAPAGLPYAHRLSSPRNDVARPERPGASASNLRQARYRMCIYLHGGPLSCSANQQHQKKATYHVSSTYFFHSLHIMER